MISLIGHKESLCGSSLTVTKKQHEMNPNFVIVACSKESTLDEFNRILSNQAGRGRQQPHKCAYLTIKSVVPYIYINRCDKNT